MKAKIAVATVSGKAYYLIVDELKKKSTPFLSLTPGEPVPAEVKAVITTEKEQCLVKHDRVLVIHEGTEPEVLISEALRAAQGKEYYEKVTVGVDPGEVLGLAVLGDGRVIETSICCGIQETLDKIKNILKKLENAPVKSISIKIGNGVPACQQKLLQILDRQLPKSIELESVIEAGTSKHFGEAKHRRGLRDIMSAIKIAGRNGEVMHRRGMNEQDHRKRSDSVS